MALRHILRVARNEVARLGAPLGSPRVLAATLLMAALLGALAPAVGERGILPDRDLFEAEVDQSPLQPALEADHRFAVRGPLAPAAREPDLRIAGELVRFDRTSDLALGAGKEMQRATRAWLDAQMQDEEDVAAAFPVRIDLLYAPRELDRELGGQTDTPAAAPSPSGGANDTSAEALQAQVETTEIRGDLSPGQVEPPFPMRSLLLTFAFLIPINFITQVQAGSLHQERVRGRALGLLVSPMRGREVVIGKCLPYGLFAFVAYAAVAWGIGAGWMGFAASLPIMAVGLGASALLALTARGPREMTALLVGVNVLLSTFLFLPAVFVQIHPIAFLSPVAVIASAIRGDAVSTAEFFYATVPLTLVAVSTAAVSLALFREETLFAPASPLSRLVDGLARLIQKPSHAVLAAMLAVPFALAFEAFLLVFALSLDLRAAFVAFLFGAAFIEEALKGIVAYAWVQRRPTKVKGALAAAGLIGFGFFLGEKGALLWSLIGLDFLPLGRATLATFGLGSPLLLLAPLFLHAGATAVFALFALRGRRWAGVGWLAAGLLHVIYNASVFFFSGVAN